MENRDAQLEQFMARHAMQRGSRWNTRKSSVMSAVLPTRSSTTPSTMLSTLLCSLVILAGQVPSELHAAAPPKSSQAAAESPRSISQRAAKLADEGEWEEAIKVWREAYGLVAQDEAQAPMREEILVSIAHAERQLFDRDGEAAHLVVADELLARAEESYLARTPNPDEGDPTLVELKVRRAELAELQASTDREPEGEVSEPPPEGPVAEPRPMDPALRRQKRAGNGLVIGGSVVFVGGLTSMVVVALPFVVAAEIVEDRQANNTVVSDAELMRREEYRRDAAKTSALIGFGLTVTGAAILAAGLATRARANRKLGLPATPQKSRRPFRLGLGPLGASLAF